MNVVALGGRARRVQWDPEGLKHTPARRRRIFLNIVAVSYGYPAKDVSIAGVSKRFVTHVLCQWVGSDITDLTESKDGLVRAVQAFLHRATHRWFEIADLDRVYSVLNTKTKGESIAPC